MKLIVGLGNPGSKYELTRHNIGKRSVTAFAEAERLSFKADANLKASICVWDSPSGKVLIAFPDSYMNLSGESVRLICDYYKIDTERDLLVIVDDVALPLGSVRLRAVGSTGGHNGLASIEKFVGHSKYQRLKIGVGGHINTCDSINDFLKGKPLEDYVVEKFTDSEEKELKLMLSHAVQSCRFWVEKSFVEATKSINIKKYSD